MTNPAFGGVQPQSENPPYIIVEPYYKDEDTGALYVHKDLEKVQDAWAEEEHISPPKADEAFGDVESWVFYVQNQGYTDAEFLTWNSKGLCAVLDYHTEEAAGRCQWIARYPFEPTPEFQAWCAIANDHAIGQQRIVEFLDDHAPDIFEPDSSTLLTLLRSLRANVTSTAETDLRPDGTASVRFARNARVNSDNDVVLPGEITIAVPVLKGHVDENGAPVRYKLVLKVRASVDNDAKLALRFSMPARETVLEQVYAERVAAAKALLGDDYTLLRAAG